MQIDPHKNIKDEELIRKIKNDGDSSWYEVIYTRYYARVTDKCYSLLKDKSLAKEMARDVLSKAYEKLDSFKGQSSFSSWLYSITYNQCIDYLRNKKKLHYPAWNKENEIPEIIDEAEEAPELTLEHLEKAMEEIHPEEKALLLMRYEYNLSFKQIGVSLRITESAAKMRMKRAKARLLYVLKELEKE